MTLNDTTPFATVAEADSYFDPLNNHMYCEEWWATDLGAKASFTTNFAALESNLTITDKAYGVAGNLRSVYFDDDGAESVIVSGNAIIININLGVSTAATIKTLLEAASDFTDIATVALTGSTGAGLVEEQATYYLFGGVDPEAARNGMKLPALAEATRKLNGMPYKGLKAVDGQANAFPRKYALPDGTTYTQTAVPDEVKMACCEEALAIIKYGNTERYKLQTQGVKSWGFGNLGLRESYVGGMAGNLISGEALNMIRKFMRRNYLMSR